MMPTAFDTKCLQMPLRPMRARHISLGFCCSARSSIWPPIAAKRVRNITRDASGAAMAWLIGNDDGRHHRDRQRLARAVMIGGCALAPAASAAWRPCGSLCDGLRRAADAAMPRAGASLVAVAAEAAAAARPPRPPPSMIPRRVGALAAPVRGRRCYAAAAARPPRAAVRMISPHRF